MAWACKAKEKHLPTPTQKTKAYRITSNKKENSKHETERKHEKEKHALAVFVNDRMSIIRLGTNMLGVRQTRAGFYIYGERFHSEYLHNWTWVVLGVTTIVDLTILTPGASQGGGLGPSQQSNVSFSCMCVCIYICDHACTACNIYSSRFDHTFLHLIIRISDGHRYAGDLFKMMHTRAILAQVVLQ